MAPALQERPQVLLPPNVVDHHQDAAAAKRLAELCRGGVQGLEVRTLPREDVTRSETTAISCPGFSPSSAHRMPSK